MLSASRTIRAIVERNASRTAGAIAERWSVIRGFPTITVPAGFTTEVYDRVVDKTSKDGTRLVGPTPARLPIGIDFAARPFDEPTLLRIAAAYEAGTKHRAPPPDFGPLASQPVSSTAKP